MKKALIVRYGAYGDIIHMSWIPRALKEDGYDIVDVETNFKGYQLLSHNPFIDNITMFEPSNFPEMTVAHLNNRLLHESVNYDRTINLFNSLEHGCIAMEDQSLFYMDDKTRRTYGGGSFYDNTAKFAGLHGWIGKARGEVYFTDKENEQARLKIEEKSDKFKVVLNINGTGPHKLFKYANDVAEQILSEFPDAFIYTTGDTPSADIKHTDRSATWIGKIPFREALARIKHVDCIIGCESGLMCGASMWGTPAIQIMTSSSIENHCKYAENDYSIQSTASCSPCHKGLYQYRGCHYKDDYPVCVDVAASDIMERVRTIYDGFSKQKSNK